MQVDNEAIDEGLYSRQLYVLGHEGEFWPNHIFFLPDKY